MMTSIKVPVVLDVGSLSTRAGFANTATPTLIFPTIVSRRDGTTFIGNDAKACDGTQKNVVDGWVSDWDAMESIWRYTFEQLKIKITEHPIVVNYPYYPCIKSHKETMAQIMFEEFNVPALHFSNQAVLSLYSYGRLSGLVLNSGFIESQCFPVYEGHILERAMSRGCCVAGQHLTNSLSSYLQKKDLKCDFETVREIYETFYISQNPDTEIASEETYNLPDGKSVILGKERYLIPEELFTSFYENSVVQDHVVGAIQSRYCDPELRKDLITNIILAGGNTLLPGFTERLEKELKNFFKNDKEPYLQCYQNVKVTALSNRGISAWTGGTILGSLSTFYNMCMSREEYNERGPTLVHTQFF